MPIISENFKMRPRHNWYSKIIRKYYKIRVGLTKPRNPISDKDIREKAEKEGRLIIQIPFGGLGDHLVYSSLPELLWEQKKIKTFISEKSIFRSGVIKAFIWGQNPYIEFTGRSGWYINKPLTIKDKFSTIDEYLQNLFGLRANGCPKIYYKPNIVAELNGKTVIDVSFGPTGKKNGYFSKAFHRKLITYIEDKIGAFAVLVHKHSKRKNNLEEKIKKTFSPKIYNVYNLEQLCDFLHSASERHLLHTGTASIVAALNLKSNIINYEKPSTYEHFIYPSNKHIHLKKQG